MQQKANRAAPSGPTKSNAAPSDHELERLEGLKGLEKALGGLVLRLGKEADGAHLVENTLGLHPDVLHRRVTRAVDDVLDTNLDLFEVVSGESTLLVSQLDEQGVGKEGRQGSLSEGDDTHQQPAQGDNLQESSKLDGLVVVSSDKVADSLGQWVGLWNVQRRQDEVLGVRQDVEGGKQKENHQRQQHMGRSNEKQHTQEQVLGVVLGKQLRRIEPVLLDRLEDQHAKRLDHSQKSQRVPELVGSREHLDVGEGVENRGNDSYDVTNVPGELEGLDGSRDVLFRSGGRGGAFGANIDFFGCRHCN